MQLAELKLWNFRKYGNPAHSNKIYLDQPHLTVEFKKGLNVLVGENDSGKTAIIDSIKYILGTRSLDYFRLEQKDFYQESPKDQRAAELRIECLFNDFSDAEAGSFLEWIAINDKGEYELRIWLTAYCKDNSVITNIRAGHDDEGVFLDGEAKENLQITYLKPLRDALAELTPGYKSRLARILEAHEVFKDEKDGDGKKKKHHLEVKAEEANEIVRSYFNINGNKEQEATKGAAITQGINKLLKVFSFDGESKEPAITITDSELSEILKSLKLVNDSNKAGLGSLNKLYMAAEFLLLSQTKGRGLLLTLIEEIEAHLHPQAQLKIIEELQNNLMFNGQIILTTHSTTLASKVKLDNLILCKDNEAFPMHKGKTELNEKNYEFLERFLDATKANLFFARGVIMVEGDAENLLIPTIAEILDRPLQNYGVSVVNIGNTAFMHYAKIFQRKDNKRLNIPVACITDLDIAQKINGKEIQTKPRKKKSNEDLITDDDAETEKKEETYIPEAEVERAKKKSIETKGSTVKVFTSPLWTLEFDIMNSTEFTRELLITAILEAQYIKNKETYDGISDEDEKKKSAAAKKKIDGKTPEWLACDIYTKYLDGERVSKAVTAQRFASLLKKHIADVKPILEKAKEFKYIRDAIAHATGKPF